MTSLFAEGYEHPPLKLKAKLVALNWPFLLLITAITMIGVAALYSVAGGDLEPWASRHVVRYCLGLALLFAVALSDIRWWLRAAYPLYFVALLMLAAVIVFGVESGGAKRWLGYGEMSFQPSEMMKLALPLMREHAPGSIINISSIAGLIASDTMPAYNSSKAAVWMLTKSIALHCAKNNMQIRCNSVHPTFVDTPILDGTARNHNLDKGVLLEKLARQIPLKFVGEPTGQHPGEDVTRAAGRHPGTAGWIDEDLSVRCCDERTVSLEHDVQLLRLGEVPRDPHTVGLDIIHRAADQTCHLAWVRRDDHVASIAPGERGWFVREGIQRVGIQHEWNLAVLEQLANERRHALPPAQPGTDRHHVGAQSQSVFSRGEIDGAVDGLLEWLGHVLGHLRRHDRRAAAWRGHRHQAGARLQRTLRGQYRRPSLAARSGHDENAAEIALMRVGLSRRNQRTNLIPGHQLDERSFERVDDEGRYADVGDDHLARLLLRRRQDERQLRRAERDGDRRLDAIADQVRGVGRHPRRQVDRDDRNPAGVQVGDDRLVQPIERAAEAGPEQRVDDQIVPGNLGEMQLPLSLVVDLDDGDAEAAENLEVDARIALDLAHLSDDEDGCLDAALMQRARDDEAVAAVVPLATNDGHAAFGEVLIERLHRRHDLPAGVFHQDE